MAAARVQYALERTLPSLTSLEAQGLFTRAELRALTHQRSVFEASLVRRNVQRRDFEAYLGFEERFERLRELRVKRLAEPLSPHDAARARAEGAARSIAIWERGVKRLRGDVIFWHAYLRWVREKKMRLVAARVSARALALHPNVPALWIESADHELHANAAPAAARALLQRAIRLNARPHNVEGEAGVRPTKRVRTELGAVQASSTTAVEAPSSSPSPSTRISPKEAQLVALWLEYVRMELVFLERLRRRWAVLGIAGKTTEAQENKAVADVEAGLHAEAKTAAEGDEETAVLENVPTTDADAVTSSGADTTAPPPEAAANPAASIVAGAIPLSILSGALDLSSTTSLPPNTHFVFLLGLANLVRSFPFLSPSAEAAAVEKDSDARINLLGAIEQAFDVRFPGHAAAALWRAGRQVLDTSILVLDEEEERESSQALLSHGKLIASGAEERIASLLHHTQAQGQAAKSSAATSIIVAHLTHAFNHSPPSSAPPVLVRSTLEALERFLTAQPSGALFSATLDLTRAWGASERADATLRAYLAALARRFVAQATKAGPEATTAVAADAVTLSLHALRQKAGNEKDSNAWKKLHNEASKSCTLLIEANPEASDAQKLTQLLLTRIEIRQALAHAQAEQGRESMQKEWSVVLNLAKQHESVHETTLYQAWCAWIEKEVLSGAKEARKWARGNLETAIRTTRSLPAAHEAVVLTYLRLSLCTWDAQFAFVRAHARSSESIWIHIVASARSAAGLASSNDAEDKEDEKEWSDLEPPIRDRLEKLYAYVGTKEQATASQRFAYVRFLYADKKDVAAALTALRTVCREVDEKDRRNIEALWEDLCGNAEEKEDVLSAGEEGDAMEEDEAEE